MTWMAENLHIVHCTSLNQIIHLMIFSTSKSKCSKFSLIVSPAWVEIQPQLSIISVTSCDSPTNDWCPDERDTHVKAHFNHIMGFQCVVEVLEIWSAGAVAIDYFTDQVFCSRHAVQFHFGLILLTSMTSLPGSCCSLTFIILFCQILVVNKLLVIHYSHNTLYPLTQ